MSGMRNPRLYLYVTKKDENPEVIRRYKWYTKLFKFILRNPAMFRDRMLSIHDAHGLLFDISWDVVNRLDSLNLKEGEMRKHIRKWNQN